MSQTSIDPPSYRVRWTDPYAITARLPESKFFVTGGYRYGAYEGRKLEAREYRIGGTPTDWLFLWYGRTEYLVKGRSSGSRLRTEADSFGGRAILKRPSDTDRSTLALQLEYIRPTDASVRTSGSAARFEGPSIYNVALNLEDPATRFTYQLGYTNVNGAGPVQASVYNVALGRDFFVSERFRILGQASLIGESWKDGLGRAKDFDVRLALGGTASYRFLPWLAVEGDLTFFPAGVPFAYGSTTNLGAFLPYEPGGPAAGLRKDPVGFATLRLVAGIKF
ncbi:hypothetical protein EON79_01735 [bacterium]|nr:MAG: hypothetical protein EON79_01735 [bacterium]